MIGGLIFGSLSDRFGRKNMMLVCLYTQCIIGIGLHFVRRLVMFMGLRFFQGIFIQVNSPTYKCILSTPSRIHGRAKLNWHWKYIGLHMFSHAQCRSFFLVRVRQFYCLSHNTLSSKNAQIWILTLNYNGTGSGENKSDCLISQLEIQGLFTIKPTRKSKDSSFKGHSWPRINLISEPSMSR